MSRPRVFSSPQIVHRQRRSLTAAFAAALLAGQMAVAQEEVWIRESSGSWSDPVSWLDGSAPLPGGGAALTLRFAPPGSLTDSVATNNLAGAFSLNRLVFERNAANAFSLAGAAGASLRFTGVDPRIELRGTGDNFITLPVSLNPASGSAAIVGSGPGTLTISSTIATGAGVPLVIDTGASSPNAGIVRLSSAQTFTSGVVLKSGNLLLSSDTALGTGALTVQGGALSLQGFSLSLSNHIALESDLLLRPSPEAGSATLRGLISSTMPGAGVVLRTAGGTITFTAASTYNGATTLDYSRAPQSAASDGGTLSLSGSGSALQTSAFDIRAGSTLLLTGATAANRVGDSTPIHLRGGGVAVVSSNGAGVTHTETVGPLDGAGFSPVTLTAGTSVNTRLTAQSLARTERGTFLFRGTALGNAFGNGVSNLLFTTAPSLTGGGGAGPAISILPYAIGDTSAVGSGAGFVTYTPATGIRPLNSSTEYRTTLASAAAGENVRVTVAQTLTAAQTINALLIDNGSIGGSGTLTVASGAILHRSGFGIAAPLNFGGVEANIFAVGSFAINGAIAGSNGLTKSGAGTLTLGAANSFTGPLTINAGTIAFSAANRLGADVSAIVVNGHGAGLSYTGTSALDFSRPIETRTGLARLNASGTGDLTITTPITGAGGLQISTTAGRTITLPAGSTYTGTTHLGTSRVVIPGDSALGNGSALNLAGATLALAGPWTTAREIHVGSGVLDTAGFDATWSGTFTGTGAFEKRGAGTLRLTTASNYRSPISLTGGMLALSDSGALSASFTISGGAELQLDQSGMVVPDRLGDRSGITLSGGKLSLIGNATMAISERIGNLTLGSVQDHTVSLTSPGAASTVLRLAAGITFNGGNLILRAAQLGGEAGGVHQRVQVDSPVTLGGGVIPGVYAHTAPFGLGASFVVYDASTDAAGPIGLRPLRAGEYEDGPLLQNPANGGPTPMNANFLANTATVAAGESNTVGTLTLGPGGSVALANGQTLAISSGRVLGRAGGSSFTGGTLQFGARPAEFHAVGEMTVSSTVTGSAGLRKNGPGTLVFAGSIGYTGGTQVTDGVLRPGGGDPFADETVTINAPGVLDIGAGAFSVARLEGLGTVALGGGTLTLGVPGTDFVSSNAFSGTGRIAFADSANPKLRRTFFGASTFSGEVVLDGGELIVSGIGALGPSTWIVNGGAVSGWATISPRLVLHADLPIVGSLLTLGPGSSATGAHDVLLRAQGTLDVTGPLTLEGRLGTQFAPGDFFSPTVGSIVVGGAAGSVTTAAGLRMEAGGGLVLNNTDAPSPAGGRLGDTTPVHLGGGRLTLTSNAAANVTETFGALSSAGFSSVELQPTSTSGAVLQAASLLRVERGTFSFQSLGALGAAPGPNVGQFFATAAPALTGGGGTLTNTSIIPSAVGLGTSGWGLVTYGVQGVRPLTSAEYVTSIAATAATSNVQLTTSTGNAVNRTINALVLGGVTLSGPGRVTITSGTVVAAQNSVISAPLGFGTAEAQFFLMAPGDTEVSGAISGSGGLTRSGPGALTLSSTNTFTGPITINDGVLNFSTSAHLGAGLDPITLHGSGASLTFTGAASVTVARPVRLGGGVSQFAAFQSTGLLQMTGAISGPGGLRLTGSGAIRLSGANSYTGPTFLGATTMITSDAVFGESSTIAFVASLNPILRLAGNWTTSRRFAVPTSATIDTNGFDAVFDAPPIVAASATLTKLGAGAMRLRTPQQFDGSLTVAGGELRLEQNGVLGQVSGTVAPGGVLHLDNSGTAHNDRLPDTGFLYLNGGEIRLTGNSTTAVNERIGYLSVSANTTGTITLNPGGAVGTTLTLSTLTLSTLDQNTGKIRFRGDNLGGPAGSAFTRIVFATAPYFPGGLIPDALASASSNGAGATFAIYDYASDAAGVVGIRPLLEADYVTGPEIRNPANGGTTSVNARFRVTGPTTAGGVGNDLNLLRLSGPSAITLNPGQALSVASATVIADAGAAASISGGTLILPASPAQLLTNGNLSISSRVDAPALTKTGVGTLTIGHAAAWPGIFNLNQGKVVVAGGGALRFTALKMAGGTTLDFSQLPATVGSITGTGPITLAAGGNLTVQSLATTSTVSGPGGLTIASHAFLTTPVTFSGALVITAENKHPNFTPEVILSGSGTVLNAASVRIDAGTVLNLNNSGISISRLGVVPVELNGGGLIMTGGSNVVAQSLGTLTTRGFSTLTLYPVGAQTTFNFNGISRADRGTLHVSSNASFLGTGLMNFPPSASFGLVGAGTTTRNLRIVPFATGLGNSFYGIVPVTFESGNGIRPLEPNELSIDLITGDNVQIRDGALTNHATATVNSLTAQTDLLGTGTVTVTSGLVIGSGATRIENGLSFGAAEAILSSHQSSGSLTLSGPLNGSGGLTKSGTGTIVLPAMNNIAGTLTINAGALSFSNPAQIGPGTEPVVMHSGGLQWSGAGDLVFPRAIRLLAGGFGSIGSTDPAATLHLAQPITGTGGLNLTGRVVFDTARAYTGPTQISGTLLLGSDALLGASSQVRFNGGTLALTGPWNTGREVSVLPPGFFTSTIDTAGFDAIVSGSFFGGGFLTKIGAGNLTLGDAAGFSGQLIINSGKVILGNSGYSSSNRIHDSAVIRLAGGALEIPGDPVTTREIFADLTLAGGTVSRLRLTVPGAASQFLEAGVLRRETNAFAIVEADRLGESEGVFTRFVVTPSGPTPGILIPSIIIADTTGRPTGIAIYDGTIDEAGPVGLRAARPGEYASGAIIQNPENGGSTPATAHFRASGAVHAGPFPATVQTLTLEPATALSLPPVGRLSVGPALITLAGNAPSVISGGTLAFSSTSLIVAGHDLTIYSRIGDSPFQSGTLHKFGPAILNLHGTVTNQSVSVGEGAIRLAGGDPLAGASVSITAGATLDTASRAVTVGSLAGNGIIDLGINGLLSTKFTSTFSGSTRGNGSLRIGQHGFLASLTPAGSLRHAGPIVVDSGSLVLQGTGRLDGATSVRMAGYGTLSLLNSTGLSATTTLQFEQGTLDLQPGAPSLQLGAIAGHGHGSIVARNDTAALQVDFASLDRGPDGSATFRILASNASLGAAPGPGVANLRFGPGFSAHLVGDAGFTPVIPFMSATVGVGDNGNNTLLTYDPMLGVRLLTDAEYSTTPVAGSNYRIPDGFTTINDTISVNSLSGTANGGFLSGSGRVQITGGVIASNSAVIQIPIDFGSQPGHVLGRARIHAPISGTGGLTLSGGEIDLRAVNTFTGPLVINSGYIRFTSLSAFGPDPSPITIYGSTFSQEGGGPLNFTRPLRLAGGVVTLQGSSNSQIQIGAPISGPGGISLQFSGTTNLTGANSYTGPTILRTDVTINGGTAFGQTSKIDLEGGTLRSTAPWTLSQPVHMTGFFTVNTGTFDGALLGPLSSSSAGLQLTKAGAARLHISDASAFTGTLVVTEGMLELNGPLAGGITVRGGATLTGSGAVKGTVTVAGTLDPGEGIGEFTAGLLQIQDNATLRLWLDSAITFDRVVSLNAPSLGRNITLDLQTAPGFDPADYIDEFVLIENESASPLLFSGESPLVYAGNALSEGEIFSTPGQLWRISYAGGTGNDVTVRAVPEPSAGVFSALGFAIFAARRRRRENWKAARR